MAVAILHFGREVDECFPLLRQGDCSIQCIQKFVDINQLSRAGSSYDLVSSTDVEGEDCWTAAEEARGHLLVPAILFQVRRASLDTQGTQQSVISVASDYDLVITADESPQVWIPKLEKLAALGQKLRGASKQLIANSMQLKHLASTLVEKTPTEIERAGSLRQQDDVSMPIPNMLADRILRCKACGENFVFHAGEQLLFQLHRLVHAPDKCSRCKSDRRAL